MANIRLNNYTPEPGTVFSVPVLMKYGTAAGSLPLGDPESVSTLIWNEAVDVTPIATGSRAHLFCAPDRVFKEAPNGAKWESAGDFHLAIIDTIASIKSEGLPLTEWIGKIGNAYCLEYGNPITLGCEVGLTNKDGDAISQRFSFTRVGNTGRVDAYSWSVNTTPFYIDVENTEVEFTGWLHDGVDKNNMYSGYHKDPLTDKLYRLDVNKNKSGFTIEDVSTRSIEIYRGIGFETDSFGNDCARDILVLIDWNDTQYYNSISGFDENNLPIVVQVSAPKTIILAAWSTGGGMDSTRLYVTTDPDANRVDIDLYPAAPAEEFEFIPIGGGGGGGGGNKGHGGRAVGGSIPMRITSRGDIDYRHFLDLYDETNYPERNMFLTNFVGRIPYKLVDYDSSEAGGTGTIRVSTDLQFTHFVGASFTDDNVPRVYEVISHRSMGGSPDVLLCTFRVCYLKDYFQHFGVTAENEMLVTRSTYSGLYNPWLRDSRMFSEAVTENGWDYGSGGFNFGLNSALVVLTDGRAVVLPIPSYDSPGYSHTVVPAVQDKPEYYFYSTTTFAGMLECIEDVDADPLSSVYTASFVNAVLSKIKAVYMVSSQMFSSGSATHVQMRVDMSYFTDPTDPENTLQKRVGIFDLLGYEVTHPEWPISYTAGFLGGGSFSDWTDLDANYQMMIPWYGSCEISGVELKRIIDAGEGSIGVQYRVSALDGTITVAIGGTAGKVIRSWKPLPRLAMPQSSRTLSYKQTNEQIRREGAIRDDQTILTSIASIGAGLVSGGVALATGNPIAAAVAVGGGIAGAVGANISNDMRDRSAAIGSDIARTNITFNSTSCEGYELLSIQTMRIIKVKKTEILNVYSTIGYPTRALWRNVGAINGFKYWISILGTIRGTSAYAQAVRGEIERDGIIYNYS